jgi:2-oxoglutarate dehydrogenase complex dehydrogenase (E1) component-like enzyme
LEATRRSFNKDFLLALAADFKRHGPEAIAKVRRQQPAAYMKICALLVPREMKVEHRNPLKELTDDELEAMLEYLKASLEAQGKARR